MDAKKALKKLKKKLKPESHVSHQALAGLKKKAPANSWLGEELKGEVKQISQDTLRSVASELATPLNPLFSWFNDGYSGSGLSLSSITASPHAHKSDSQPAAPTISRITQQSLALAKLPLKSPACKRCPALSGGLCKCAVKKFGLKAA
ncbi:hypothetical protein ABT56_12945 [Photobacterium aquae]|uniref:Uncharacterized protein n=1 Tax=Photobacterium aquae TaxID=1195763 RepID=A0A0J1GZV7_9GAMM|nr:hypothetical protein [Photobacterium aquae]KLV05100.1 hypothetical protein ABT56_12945 [Photobacterium aquae]